MRLVFILKLRVLACRNGNKTRKSCLILTVGLSGGLCLNGSGEAPDETIRVLQLPITLTPRPFCNFLNLSRPCFFGPFECYIHIARFQMKDCRGSLEIYR
eukprot:Gb_00414 [translate_table: standard]